MPSATSIEFVAGRQNRVGDHWNFCRRNKVIRACGNCLRIDYCSRQQSRSSSSPALRRESRRNLRDNVALPSTPHDRHPNIHRNKRALRRPRRTANQQFCDARHFVNAAMAEVRPPFPGGPAPRQHRWVIPYGRHLSPRRHSPSRPALQSASSMIPANPPLPRPCNFPFQLFRGNHTSMPILESADGVAFTMTWQKAGSAL